MAFAVVQNATGVTYNSGVGVTATNSLPVAATTGNVVIGTVLIQDNSTGITVVDNHSVSAPQALLVRDSISTGYNIGVFVKVNVTGGPTSWTVTNVGGGANANMFMALEEYSGFGASAAVDGTPVGVPLATTTGANSMSTGNTTTTVNGDFVWSFVWTVVDGANNLMTVGTTPAYTVNLNNPGTNSYIWTEWLTQAASGNIAGTWQSAGTTGTVVVGIVAISNGAAAAGRPHVIHLLGGMVGWRAPFLGSPLPLLGGAAAKLGSAIRRNATLSRRSFLIGHNGGPPLDD